MTPLLPILFGLSSWMQTPSADRVKAIAAELARIGFEVDVAKISVEDAKKADCVADMERQQDLFFRRSHFEGIQVLLRGFGLITTKDAKDLRKSTAESLLASFQAYYQPDRKTLVFLGSAADEILAHELTHAWQDQTRGFSRMLPGEKDESARTYEQVRLSQCLIEGEAQLVGGAVMFAREGRKLDTLTPDDLDETMIKLFAGPAASLPYRAGERFLLALYQKGGWPAVASAFEGRPPSTEQILHSEKIGIDNPVVVDLPSWPKEGGSAEILHDDVIGELGIRSLLTERGVPESEAFVAAAGWDGDRLCVWSTTDGRRAAMWRTVWDREKDAEQFAAAVKGRLEGWTSRHGRIYDWAWAEDSELLAKLGEVLRADDAVSAVGSQDASTTEEAESAWQARLSRVEGARWKLPQFGLSLRIPEGWSESEVRGNRYLFAKPEGDFRDNINVIGLPNPSGADADRLLADNELQIRAAVGLTLDSISKVKLGGREVVRIEYHGRVGTVAVDLHFLALVVPKPKQQLVVTASVAESRWEQVKRVVSGALDSIEID